MLSHMLCLCCELGFCERRIKYKKIKMDKDRQMDPQSFFIFFSDAKGRVRPFPFAPKCPMVVDLMDKKLFLLFDWASIVRTLY